MKKALLLSHGADHPDVQLLETEIRNVRPDELGTRLPLKRAELTS
jgi:hypothetical protein